MLVLKDGLIDWMIELDSNFFCNSYIIEYVETMTDKREFVFSKKKNIL